MNNKTTEQKTEILTLEKLFNEKPLYVKHKIDIYSGDGKLIEGAENKVKKILGKDVKNIDSLCVYCNNFYSFDKSVSGYGIYFEQGIGSASSAYIEYNSIHLPSSVIMGTTHYKNTIWQYEFTCHKNTSHTYTMYLLLEYEKGTLSISKIGQHPSMLDIRGFDFDTYKNILKKINAYEDYKKAEHSNASKFYAGAYTYLRRIFEKMVDNYLTEIDNTETNLRINDKIDKVKDKFYVEVRPYLTPMYGILSKGIHELDDDVCKDYYEQLKSVIALQLEYIKTENDRAKKIKSLTVLNSIQNDLKNGK